MTKQWKQKKRLYKNNEITNRCIEIDYKAKIFFIEIFCDRFCIVEKSYKCDICINEIELFNRRK
jgi:hypothetical protein